MALCGDGSGGRPCRHGYLGEVCCHRTNARAMNTAPSARVFVGIKIADEIAEHLAEFVQPLRTRDVRLVPSPDIHLTLVPPWNESDTAVAIETLEAAISDFEPLPLTFVHLGYGPNLREPRLVWVECAACRELADLRTMLMAAYGKSDSRPFVPHVTLARMPRSGRAIARRNPIDRTLQLTQLVTSVEFFQSPPQGQRGYQVLASLPLGREPEER